VPGDRLVLRDAGRKRTVAGAEVLDVEPSARAKDAPALLSLPLGERLLATHAWLPVADIPRLAGCSQPQAADLVDELVRAGAGTHVGAWIVSTAALAHVRSEATTRAVAHHAAHPMERGVELVTVAAALRLTVDQVRAALEDDSTLVVERGLIRHASHVANAADTPDGQRVLAAFDAAPFAPPVPEDVGADAALVRALVREGALIDIDNVVFSANALLEARERVVEALRERGRLSVADIRDLLGSTRKYVLPIVGWLDREGVTRRRGDDRHPGPASGLGELL
jgi:selenocysteine-specific elongation factor